jgi:hypothetical protein
MAAARILNKKKADHVENFKFIWKNEFKTLTVLYLVTRTLSPFLKITEQTACYHKGGKVRPTH